MSAIGTKRTYRVALHLSHQARRWPVLRLILIGVPTPTTHAMHTICGHFPSSLTRNWPTEWPMLLTVRWPKNMAMIELVYGQCLVDARRMLRDREYCELFGGKTISPHHANEQPRAMAR